MDYRMIAHLPCGGAQRKPVGGGPGAEDRAGHRRALDCPARTCDGRAFSPRGRRAIPCREEEPRLLTHAERAETAMGVPPRRLTAPEGLTGQIRIGAPDGCANYLLPQVLARICDENPGLEVQIVALPRVFNLSKREADMAIGVSRPGRAG